MVNVLHAVLRPLLPAAAFLLTLNGCDKLPKDWPFTKRQTKIKSEPVAPAPTVPVEDPKTKAIRLAKEAHSLVAGKFYAGKPDPEVLTNEFQIRTQLSTIKGDLQIIGWQATKYDVDTYLVTYTFMQNYEVHGWPFEVKLSAELVRFVVGDPELEKLYGWGNRK